MGFVFDLLIYLFVKYIFREFKCKGKFEYLVVIGKIIVWFIVKGF